jgi:hypothetical protein
VAAALVAISVCPALAQQRVRVSGFNVAYAVPAGWSVAQRKGRVTAFSDGSDRAWIFIVGGSYVSEKEAFAEAVSILEEAKLEDEREVEPMAPRSVGGRRALAGASTATSATGERVTVRVLAIATEHSTGLGVVALGAVARDADLKRVVESVGASLDAQPPVENRQLAARMVGVWTRQQGYNSNSGGGGGYVNEEAHAFDAAGGYRYRRTSVVSVPGAAIDPSVSQGSGSWRAIGSSIVLQTREGRMTVDVQFEGEDVAIVNGVRFVRR